MRVLISGQAGVAVIIDGDCAVSIDAETHQRITRAQHDWPYLLDDADDLYELEDVPEDQIIVELDLAWKKDRALHLALILLDGEADRETRTESAELLEDFFSDDRLFQHIRNRLYAAPIPGTADVQGAIKIAKKGRRDKVAAIFEQVSEAQDRITHCRQAWDVLLPDLFGSSSNKESFGFKAVQGGLFTALTLPENVDPAQHRWADPEVIRRWKREIRSIESLQVRHDAPAKPRGGAPVDAIRAHPRILPSRSVRFALAATAGIIIAIAVAALLKPKPVAASDLVQLGTSQPGVQVVQASLKGVQQELYGRTFVPYALRSPAKKEAERLFASGEADTKAGRLQSAATAFRDSSALSSTFAARLNEAVTLFNTSDLARSESLLISLLPEAERLSEKLWKAAVLTNLGNIYRTQGRFGDADTAFSSALQIDRENGYKAGEAVNLNNLALVLLDRGKEVEALKGFQSALSVSEQAAIDSSAANSRLNIGLVLTAFGRYQEAQQNFKSAALYYQTLGSPLDQAYYSFTYGQSILVTFLNSPQSITAEELNQLPDLYRRALDLYTDVSNKSGQALALMALAQLQEGEALEFDKRALRLTEAVGDRREQAIALREIGLRYYRVRAYEEATINLRAALSIARKIGAIAEQCRALQALSAVMAATGHPNEALKYSNDAVELASNEGDALSQAFMYNNLGFLLYKLLNQRNQATTALERAYSLFSEIGSPLRDQTRALIDDVKANTLPESLDTGKFQLRL